MAALQNSRKSCIGRVLGIVLGSLLLLAASAPAAGTLEDALLRAHASLLADPSQTTQIVEKILPQIDPDRQAQAFVEAHWLAARAFSLLGDSAAVLQHAESVRGSAEKLGDPTLLVKLYAVLGEGYEFSGAADKSYEHYKLALTTAERSKDAWLIAYAANFLGWMHNRKMDEKQAMQHLQRAYTIMKGYPADDLYYDILNNLGNLYGNKVIGREQESVKLLNEAQLYYLKKDKHFYASVILYNLGLALKTGKPQEAIQAFRESMRSAEKIHDESSIAYCHYGIGVSLIALKNHAEAERELLIAEEGFVSSNNAMMHTEVQKHILINYVLAGQYGKGLHRLPAAEVLLRKHGSTADVISLLEQKINIMKGLGQKEEELAAYREYGQLSQKYQLQQDRETINRYTAEFDLERKEHEKELLSLELEKADRTRNILFGAALLFACIMVLAIRSRLKDREMRIQRRRMQQILDSIQEGILRFGADLRIERDYSQHLLHLLQRQDRLDGMNVLTVVIEPSQLTLDDKSQVRESLQAMLGEDRLAWELNASHLPTELVLHTRTLDAHWEPLFDAQARLQKLQLILRDVTESRELARRMSLWQSKMEQLLSQDFRRASQFLRETAEKTSLQLGDLHTIKGNARTLGLKTLAEVTHRLEAAWVGADAQKKAQEQEAFDQELQEWLPLIRGIGSEEQEESPHVFHLLNGMVPDLQKMLGTAGLCLEEILVHDAFRNWRPTEWKTLQTILLHGLTNALDHGYILPAGRGEIVAQARLGVEIDVIKDQLQLVIRDYGRGLDWTKIRGMAQERNFQPAAGRPWSDVLFLSGTSTTRAVTATSGRGIGLAVIASTAAELGGSVVLLDNDRGTGTRLILTWPRAESALSA